MKRYFKPACNMIACLIMMLTITGVGPAFAATTITDWATAQSGFPGSTAGNSGDAAAGIVWSRHNLSSYGSPLQAQNVTFFPDPVFMFEAGVATTEICVFCHTPHFGQSATAPLWNRGSSASGYVAYGASATATSGSTLAGTAVNAITGSTGGSSLACLSCHDGVTTFDNLINKPGKGSKVGSTTTTNWGADVGWRFYMDTNITGAVTLEHFSNNPASCDSCHPQGESDRLNIGLGPNFNYAAKTVDVSNDHPINIPYNDTVASLRPAATTISSISMINARSNGDDITRDGYGRSDNLWAVKGFISSTATISDLLRDGGKVQCTSCHDPHYKNQTNNDPSVIDSYDRVGGSAGYNYDVTSQFDAKIDGLFLRRVGGNSNSGVCRTCHNK